MTHPALTELLLHLRSTTGIQLHVQPSPAADQLVLQVGDQPDAVVGITLRDERPSYRVSYPKLIIKRSGDQLVDCVQADDVLIGGVIWIVKQLAKHGMVVPESVDRP